MFYVGVVEDNNDTDLLGRCKVRIFGKHDLNSVAYPTSDLPWADNLNQITSTNGVGSFEVPEVGCWVVCGFFDPKEQRPFYLGSIPRIQDGTSTIPGNARASEQKSLATIKGEAALGALGDYPKNKVIQTAAGHILEIDDTTGKEKITVYHKTGAAIELQANGNLIMRSPANAELGATNNIKEWSAAKAEDIDNASVETVGNKAITADTTINFAAGTTFDLSSPGAAINMNDSGDASIDCSGNVNFEAEGTLQISATGAITIQGSSVTLIGGSTLVV